MSASSLPRSAPEAQGIASSAILAFIEAAEQQTPELHSLMLLRHGQVVAEGWWAPYGPQYLHLLFSLSKSFASTAAGLAAAEGKLSLQDKVLSYFPEDAPETVSENLAAMRIWDLLTMSTGHAKDTTGSLRDQPDGNWPKAFLAQPVEFAPGTHFLYNSGATYMVSAIVQKVTGVPILEYLGPRLFEPLGIAGSTWETCPRGINVGGWGLSVRTEDIARFGQLYLQDGVWEGKRILPEGWVAEASARQVPNGDNPESDWNQGYGYQFWRCRHGAYRGDGAFGQYCVVLPEQDTVVAITSGVNNMQAALSLIWEHLLPALGSEALPEDPAAQEALRQKLQSLALRTPEGPASTERTATVSGKTYRFAPNDQKIETATLTFAEDGCTVRVENATGEHEVVCGTAGDWKRGTTTLEGPTRNAVAASGAWEDADTYVARICFYETPFIATLRCHFEGDQMTCDYRMNVGFGPTDRPPLVGQVG